MEVCRNFCLLAFIMATNMVASSVDVKTNKQQSLIVARGEAAVQEVALPKNTITKRHTPFLPSDYWKDRRPEFGDTNTAVEVMVNGTSRSSVDVKTNKLQNLIGSRGKPAVQEVALPKNTITKRHTPFLPGDYWKDRRPEFGDTNTEVEVMVNGTGRLKCPITHVADSSVS